ncbi:Legume lectin, alpha chain, conserved site [Sesbania bispinosa]|nr:Legume lectin, alpha chain, conserved site [Sesbania bispinosa]
MAISNSSKSILLHAQSPLSSLLHKIFILLLLLQLQYHNVQSQPSEDETVSFGFTHFENDNPDIFLAGDASMSGGVLRLTKTDQLGKPIPMSVGRAVHLTPVHIWDRNTGELADFTTGFSFVVNRNGSTLHGDGFAFFIAPLHLDLPPPANSSGGYLGLFSPETALDPSKNQILAIEFDSFTNGWDPDSPSQSPHVGIDVDSIKSVATAAWPIELEPENAIGEVSINYNSESKRLSVFLAYHGSDGSNRNATVTAFLDLRSFLPEWVRVGFSAATGALVETHDILTWDFIAAFAESDSVSFLFYNFKQDVIGFLGGASSSDDIIQLTERDEHGEPLQNRVGRAVYLPPVHIWDGITGELADFRTVFYFVVNRSDSELHGDGLSFFMAPLDYGIPHNSTGGFLGLVSPETAFNSSILNQVLAVEFDSFANEWDPNPLSEFSHIGINVNSIESVATVGWKSNVEPDGALVRALIRYDSQTKELFVLVSYPGSPVSGEDSATLAHTIDLRTVLPEWVRIGFSAATGDFIEKHDILFWSFVSTFRG